MGRPPASTCGWRRERGRRSRREAHPFGALPGPLAPFCSPPGMAPKGRDSPETLPQPPPLFTFLGCPLLILLVPGHSQVAVPKAGAALGSLLLLGRKRKRGAHFQTRRRGCRSRSRQALLNRPGSLWEPVLPGAIMAQAQSRDDLRILLVGKTGAGKSATGNSLLGEDLFPSSPSLSSTTEKCLKGKSSREGREITALDTPGFFDTKKRAFTQADVQAWIQLVPPGPHAILLVIKLGKMTEEEKESVRLAKKLFSGVEQFLILVFTHKDELDHNSITLATFLEPADGDLKELMVAAKNRYVAINNHAQGEEKAQQVAELIDKIDGLVRNNGKNRAFYSEEMFKNIQKVEKLEKENEDLKKREEERKKLRKQNEEMKKQNEELERKNKGLNEELKRKTKGASQNQEPPKSSWGCILS